MGRFIERTAGCGVLHFVIQSNFPEHPPFDVEKWIAHFRENGSERPEPRWKAPVEVDDEAHASLTQSLREFQLGDGGGPASLIAFDAKRFCSREGMQVLHDLWFAEEAEHSRLLLGALERLGGEPIKGHWSFSLFCLFRRWLGVAFELQILTVTELSSSSYYSLLRRHCRDCALVDVWSLILRDEAGHVRFQCDRLAAQGRSRRTLWGRLWALQFRGCGWVAATVLWISHGGCLKRLGATRREYYRSVGRQFTSFLGRLDRKAAAWGRGSTRQRCAIWGESIQA